MRKTGMILLWLALAGCDQAGEPAPQKQVSLDQDSVTEAVEQANQFTGDVEDESGDCGRIDWLLEKLPGEALMGDLELSYRGCESPVTAMVIYENGQRYEMASITVLDPALASLSEDSSHQWHEILDETRASVMRDMAQQQGIMQITRSA